MNLHAPARMARHVHGVAAALRRTLRRLVDWPHAVANAWRRPWADVGIVAGSATTRILVAGQGIRSEVASCQAIDPVSHRVVARGLEARRMRGRAPASIVVQSPFRHGRIGNFEVASTFLADLLRQASRGIHLAGLRAVVAVPGDTTPLARLCMRETVQAAGARAVHLVDAGLAAALGNGVSLDVARGAMSVDIGAGQTQITVTGLGGIVYSQTLPLGGDAMDEAIVAWLKNHRHVTIGLDAAEELKRRLGHALAHGASLTAEVGGRDRGDGVPRKVTVSSDEIRQALTPVLDSLIEPLRAAVARLSSPMLSDIMEDGITLSGGASQLRGLPEFVARRVGVPAHVCEDPANRVGLGVQRMLENKRLLRAALITEAPPPTASHAERGPAPRRRVGLATAAALLLIIGGLLWLRPPLLSPVAATAQDVPVEAALGPVVNQGVLNVSAWARALWQGVADNQALRDRVPLLETKLADSHRQVTALAAENHQMAHLLKLRDSQGPATLAAHLVLRDPSGWLSTVVIDKGTLDGVRPAMAASAEGGLLGEVVWCGPHTSRVRLLTGPNAVIACKVAGRNAAGILYGSGSEECEVRYLDPDATLHSGDAVITSGLDGTCPPGIPVGRITRIAPSRDTVYRVAQVKPSALIDSATVVLLHPTKP